MKVYVSEMPKCCRECPCSIYDELDCCWCKAINGELTYITDNDFESKRLNSCPLHSLADYTKQVRKEVLGELMNMLGDRAELVECGSVAEFMFTTYDLQESINEILGEKEHI